MRDAGNVRVTVIVSVDGRASNGTFVTLAQKRTTVYDVKRTASEVRQRVLSMSAEAAECIAGEIDTPDTCRVCGKPRLLKAHNWQYRFGWHICLECWREYLQTQQVTEPCAV